MYFSRQNKNRYVMGYLAWRVMTGLNREITYMMQDPGMEGPDSLVDKASALGAGGRRFDSQCRRHWGSF